MAINTEIDREKVSVNFVFYILIVIFALYSDNRIQDFYIICSIASESPPRKMNEQYITIVESLRIGAGFLIDCNGLW